MRESFETMREVDDCDSVSAHVVISSFSTSNVRAIRPGCGLSAKHIDGVLGRRARMDVARGTPLSWDLLQ
jgi:hypothetical protein